MNAPRIVPDRDRYRKWYLDEDFAVELTNGDRLYINKGFRFDAHSVPFLFRPFFPQYDVDIIASLVHDYLIDTAPWHRYTRKFMDNEYTALMHQHSHGLRRFFMPKAVRFWGWLAYDIWGDYRGELKPNTRINVTVLYD